MKAVIYVRGNDAGSVRAKAEELRRYAGAKGFEIMKEFTEMETGALDGLGFPRWPVLDECRDFCLREHPDVLLVPSLRSLGYITEEIVHLADSLSGEGVSVHFGDIGVCTLSPDGSEDGTWLLVRRVLRDAFAIDNGFYRTRLRAGRERYKQSGGRLGRPRGTGMTPEETIAKYPGVASRLDMNERDGIGETIDEIASGEGVSASTVKKVKKAWLERLREQVTPMPFYDNLHKEDGGD